MVAQEPRCGGGGRDPGQEGVEGGKDWVGFPEGSAQGDKGRVDDGDGHSDRGAAARAGECWLESGFGHAGFEVMPCVPRQSS